MPVALGCLQYVTDAGCFGGFREDNFQPHASPFAAPFVEDMSRRQGIFVGQLGQPDSQIAANFPGKASKEGPKL